MRYLILSFLFAVALHGPARAGLHLVPAQFATIQDAVLAAAAGDTVLVSPGTYTGLGNRDIDFEGKDLVLRSSAGKSVTIIDVQGNPENSHRGFVFQGTETRSSLVEGFTIINGYLTDGSGGGDEALKANARGNRHDLSGGGMMIRLGASPTIRDLTIRNCFSQFSGGGMGVESTSNPLIQNVVIENCTSLFGGGLTIEFSGQGEFEDVSILGCFALDGGGLHTSGNTSFFRNVIVAGNGAQRRGGGIDIIFPAQVTFERTIVWGNCVPGDSLNFVDEAVGGLSFECSIVNPDRYWDPGNNTKWVGVNYQQDPEFCAPLDCQSSPQAGGLYGLRETSMALPANNSCGVIIGTSHDCETAVERRTWSDLKTLFRSPSRLDGR